MAEHVRVILALSLLASVLTVFALPLLAAMAMGKHAEDPRVWSQSCTHREGHLAVIGRTDHEGWCHHCGALWTRLVEVRDG